MDYVWTFVEAINEQDSDAFHRKKQCPCSNTNVTWAYEVPSFIGNDCFCDTGSHGLGYGSIFCVNGPKILLSQQMTISSPIPYSIL